jgi:hypothetical protein
MPNGPWVQVAALCEHVELGPPLRLNTLVDKVDIQGPEGAAVPISDLTLVICLWADDVPPGSYDIRIQPHAPDGTTREAASGQVHFPQTGPSGVNLISPAPFTVDTGGTYWYNVLFVEADGDTRLLSRFPLAVNWTPTIGA